MMSAPSAGAVSAISGCALLYCVAVSHSTGDGFSTLGVGLVILSVFLMIEAYVTTITSALISFQTLYAKHNGDLATRADNSWQQICWKIGTSASSTSFCRRGP